MIGYGAPDQAGQGDDARRAARRRGDRGRPREAGLAARALRGARASARRLARRRRRAARRARGLGERFASARPRRARRVRARVRAGAMPSDWRDGARAHKAEFIGRAAEARDAQGLADGARGAVRGCRSCSAARRTSPARTTRAPSSMRRCTARQLRGDYIHYGVREHGMAAAMNGLALHGGFVPYGGTFLVFTDYCRPAIRLSALMGSAVVYVMTHDSIGLGEDGPTHQPVEHLARLRAIPNLNVFRPADAIEAAECWELRAPARGPALDPVPHAPGRCRPSARARPRRTSSRAAPTCWPRRTAAAHVTLLATGSEVAPRARRARPLAAEGVPTQWCRCRAGSCSPRQAGGLPRQRARHGARASPSRRPRASAGTASSATDGRLHRHDAASAPRRRPRLSSSTSASPPRRSSPAPARRPRCRAPPDPRTPAGAP